MSICLFNSRGFQTKNRRQRARLLPRGLAFRTCNCRRLITRRKIRPMGNQRMELSHPAHHRGGPLVRARVDVRPHRWNGRVLFWQLARSSCKSAETDSPDIRETAGRNFRLTTCSRAYHSDTAVQALACPGAKKSFRVQRETGIFFFIYISRARYRNLQCIPIYYHVPHRHNKVVQFNKVVILPRNV